MEEYSRFLKERCKIREKNIPYYSLWVTECYEFLCMNPKQRLSANQTRQYLDTLATKKEDWQVKQADYALRLYNYYLASTQQSGDKKEQSGGQWDKLTEKVRTVLRLQHRVYRTEKTYLCSPEKQARRYQSPRSLKMTSCRRWVKGIVKRNMPPQVRLRRLTHNIKTERTRSVVPGGLHPLVRTYSPS